MQKELVVHILEELESKGFTVIALTMDAHASNVSMCQLLGCCFEVNGSFQYWFVLPNSSHKVCVIFDPCSSKSDRHPDARDHGAYAQYSVRDGSSKVASIRWAARIRLVYPNAAFQEI